MMHIFSMKGKTKKQKIKILPDSPLFYIPLLQHIGQPATPVVRVCDVVKRYQLIGEASAKFSANVHSPISGIVEAIIDHPLSTGQLVPTIVIKNDFNNTEIERYDKDSDSLSADDIVSIIKSAGIVGEGGAQFPTHLKYSVKDKLIDTFIVNGTECEPYLTADYALMKEKTALLFVGIDLINRILKADSVVICIEKQNEDLLIALKQFTDKKEYKHIRIQILPNEYPQGGELQLIKSVTGKELAKGEIPSKYGVVVSNVATVISVYKAVAQDVPLVERIITVSGEQAKEHGNYQVKIGTPLSHILKELDNESGSENSTIVLGGPMMGKEIVDTSVPITKGSSGVLFFAQKEIKRSNCISCGYCVDVCPMHLMPMKFEELYRKGKYQNLSKYSIDSCIECAACEYICPSNVPLIESIKEGKNKLKML